MRLEVHPGIAACMAVRKVGHGRMLQTKCGPPADEIRPLRTVRNVNSVASVLPGDACEDFPSAARPTMRSSCDSHRIRRRDTEHTRSAGLAASAGHGHQWIRGLTGGPGGAGRYPIFTMPPSRPRASRTRTAVRHRRHRPAANSTRPTAPRVMGAARKAPAVFRRSRMDGCRMWRTARFFGSSPEDPSAAPCRRGLRCLNCSVGSSLPI